MLFSQIITPYVVVAEVFTVVVVVDVVGAIDVP